MKVFAFLHSNTGHLADFVIKKKIVQHLEHFAVKLAFVV